METRIMSARTFLSLVLPAMMCAGLGTDVVCFQLESRDGKDGRRKERQCGGLHSHSLQ